MSDKQLVRSQTDHVCCGVAGGVAEYINIDSALVRLFFVLTTLFCGGFGLVVYAILWLIMPEEKTPEKTKTA